MGYAQKPQIIALADVSRGASILSFGLSLHHLPYFVCLLAAKAIVSLHIGLNKKISMFRVTGLKTLGWVDIHIFRKKI